MTVFARLPDGSRVAVDAARHGSTVEELVKGLTADAITGSAVPLADAWVKLADGTEVAWPEITLLEQDDTFP